MTRLHIILCLIFSYSLVFHVNANVRTISQSDFILVNREYLISDTCDLNGNNISIPANSTLKFTGLGCITNGSIQFNDTKLIYPNFLDCRYCGDIVVADNIIDSLFCKSSSFDQDVLCWLIEQAANNNTTLELTKDYNICCSRIYSEPYEQNNRSYVIIENKSFSIKGNKHTIYDHHEYKGHFSKDFMVLVGCHNVKIENLYFEGLHNEINNLAIEGATKFPAAGGTNVVLCLGDTKGIKIVDGKCKHCMSYIWCGCDPITPVNETNRNYYNDNLVINGFEDIDVEIDAFDTHYPIAIFKGQNVKVGLHFLYARRGCRLQGVDNADVQIHGAFATSPVMLLLKDAVSYSDNAFTSRIYNACSNIEARIVRLEEQDSITNYNWCDIALNIGCYNGLDSLATAKQFFNRKTPYEFKNINISYICNVQQYAVLFSPRKNKCLTDIYELNFKDCFGGGLTDSNISNEYSHLKLNITESNLKKISMNFNQGDDIVIRNSSIDLFENKRKSDPKIQSQQSIINYTKY